MAKAGMRRPNPSEPHGTESNHKPKFEKNSPTVPEIQGKAKTGNKKAGRIIYVFLLKFSFLTTFSIVNN